MLVPSKFRGDRPRRRPAPRARPARTERRSIEGQWHRIDFGQVRSKTGLAVTSQTALSLAAVFGCINVLSTDLASLSLEVYERLPDGGRRPATDLPLYDLLHIEPNEESTSFSLRQDTWGNTLSWGNGYGEVERTRGGEAVGWHLVTSDRCHPDRTRDGRLWYVVDGKPALPPRDVIHFKGLGRDGLVGLNPIRTVRRMIELGLATEEQGLSLFGNGVRPGGFLEHPAKITPEATKRLRESFDALYAGIEKAGKTILLEEGMKFAPAFISPQDAQWIAARQFQVIEVCRIYRVPPHKVAELSNAHYNNIEHANLDYVTTALMPWCEMAEQELTRKLIPRDQRHRYFVEHELKSLLRGDMQGRAAFYKVLRELGVLSADQIARLENLDPIGPEHGGDKRLVPLNMTTLDQAGADPARGFGGKAGGGST